MRYGAIRHRALAVLILSAIGLAASAQEAPFEVGARRELFIDRTLIAELAGEARQVLHQPAPQDVVLVHDAAWEGSGCGYHSLFRDEDRYRLYYKAWHLGEQNGKVAPRSELYTCYAESADGVHWTKPALGLVEFAGSKDNNIVLASGPIAGARVPVDAGHVAVFRDENPAAPAEARYKALLVAWSAPGLVALKSADGLHWQALHPEPVITQGAFDSQNLAFWDAARGQYRAYWRVFVQGRRDIVTATSADFIHWTEPVALEYPGAAAEQLYTNVIKPYPRAPHLLIGFPTRYVERRWSDEAYADLPELEHRRLRKNSSERYGAALTDALLMTSRDGVTFHRWGEAFLRPGVQRPGTWHYGQQYLAWHVVETAAALPGAPDELSFYATESYWTGTSSELRRYTLRGDGFVSVQAGAGGGELRTVPLTFQGRQLFLNFATSAAGSVRVEIQDAAGQALPGLTAGDCVELFGDDVDRRVRWAGGRDLAELAGRPIRLRFILRDADLFAFQFRP